MRARVKSNGELIDVEYYRTSMVDGQPVPFYQVLNWSVERMPARLYAKNDLLFIDDEKDGLEQFRLDIIQGCVTQLCVLGENTPHFYNYFLSADEVAERAIKVADALVERLKKESD